MDIPISEWLEEFEDKEVKIRINVFNEQMDLIQNLEFVGLLENKDDEMYCGTNRIVDVIQPLAEKFLWISILPTNPKDSKIRDIKFVPELDNPYLTLWYDTPAQNWNEALPIGNGHFGAMVYGRVNQETIQLNEDSVWDAGPMNRINPDAKKYLPEVRKLLLEEKFEQAMALTEMALYSIPPTQLPFQTITDLILEFNVQ